MNITNNIVEISVGALRRSGAQLTKNATDDQAIITVDLKTGEISPLGLFPLRRIGEPQLRKIHPDLRLEER